MPSTAPSTTRPERRVAAVLAGDPQNAGGGGEQREHADHAEDGQQRQHVGLGLIAPDEQQADRGADQHDGDQQHQADAAPPFAAPACRLRPRSPSGASRSLQPKPPALSVPQSGPSPQGAGVADTEFNHGALEHLPAAGTPIRRRRGDLGSRLDGSRPRSGSGRVAPTGAVEPHHVADHLGDRLVVLGRDLLRRSRRWRAACARAADSRRPGRRARRRPRGS